MSKLTQEDRSFLIGHLHRTRALVQAQVAGLRADQWTFKPDAVTWSIAECAEHILSIEKRAFLLVSNHMQAGPADPERAAQVQRKTELMLQNIPSRESRVRVPEGIHARAHPAAPEEFLQAFEAQRVTLEQYIQETEDPVHDRVAPHPFFKDLDGCQWLLMIPLHTERHVAQIGEVKARADYPG